MQTNNSDAVVKNSNHSFYYIWKRLEEFWAQQGVSILPSYDIEMGAGTYSPFSTIKMMDGIQKSYGFMQRCRRPYDSMEAQAGNRLYCFHQMQIMLNPCKENILDLFFQSLEYIGVSPLSHEIKFLESDWNSPTIGAYGVGWEVWCDGMEIAQFTHFKKIALTTCQANITEITYGMERLLLKASGESDIYQCQWDQYRTYGEIFKFYEEDFTKAQKALMDIATIEDLKTYMNKAQILIEADAPVHGYEQLVKACNIYNLMEKSNQLGNFQRQHIIKDLQKSFKLCFEQLKEDQNPTLLN